MIQPGDANYDIAQQGRKSIRHVLDRVLSDPFPSTSTDAGNGAAGEIPLGEPTFTGTDFDDGLQFLEWLDTSNNVDYRQESWVNWLTFS